MRHNTFRRLTEQRGPLPPPPGKRPPSGAGPANNGAPSPPPPPLAAAAASGIELTPGGNASAGPAGGELHNPFAAGGANSAF
jgi:hypothetical protein